MAAVVPDTHADLSQSAYGQARSTVTATPLGAAELRKTKRTGELATTSAWG
jgi:hypothetical protein